VSQYPSPYSLPPNPYVPGPLGYGWNPYEQYLKPARRAGLLMIILGSLAMFCGTCFTGLSYVPTDQLAPEQQQLLRQIEKQVGMPAAQYIRWSGIGLLGSGVVLLSVGLWVRTGTRVAVAAAAAVAGLGLVYFGLGALLLLVQGTPVPACFQCLLVALFVLLMVWLVGAWRSAGTMGAVYEQYRAQYWQHLQQQQQYGQQYPGGGTVPPPGPGGPPMPPPQQ
jgi:hypothetical protein